MRNLCMDKLREVVYGKKKMFGIVAIDGNGNFWDSTKCVCNRSGARISEGWQEKIVIKIIVPKKKK